MYYLKEEYYTNFQESGSEEEDENEPLSQDNSVSCDNNGSVSDNPGFFKLVGTNVVGATKENDGIQMKKLALKQLTCKLSIVKLCFLLMPVLILVQKCVC